MEIQVTSNECEPSKKEKFNILKVDIKNLNKKFKKTVEDCQNRINISKMVGSSSKDNSKNEKLIEMTDASSDLAYKQFTKLENSTRNVLDIESRVNSTSRELHGQTEKMMKVNSNLDGMNNGLSTSSILIKKMLKRESRNKLIIVVVSIAFILIFLMIVVMKISEKFSTKTNSSSSSTVKTNNNTTSELNNFQIQNKTSTSTNDSSKIIDDQTETEVDAENESKSGNSTELVKDDAGAEEGITESTQSKDIQNRVNN